MIDKKLPEFCYSSRSLNDISGIIIHYFSAINVEPSMPFDMDVCWDLFVDLNRPKQERQNYLLKDSDPDKRMYASAHILIGREGEEWVLCPFTRRAYHAGHSILNDRKHCNNFTIGIELVGTKESGFTDQQYNKLATICNLLMITHDFGLNSIAGHDQVRHAAIQAGMTKTKKLDPSGKSDGTGDNFDWNKLHGLIKRII